MRKLQILSILIVVLAFATGALAYSQLPGKVATHWNLQGQVDGYSSKEIGSFLIPGLTVLFLALFYALPKIDPKMKAYASFQSEYDAMVAALLGFLYYLFLLTLGFNMGYQFNMLQFLAPAFAVMLYYLGKTLIKAKQNYFVGFRTPWTLASKQVWEKTNEKAGRLFIAAAIVSLGGLAFPGIALIIAVAMVVAIAVFGVAYSYLEYRKEQKAKKR
ncbi:MAG: SdpI family protein [Candidatus Micrarchaeia archaeon]